VSVWSEDLDLDTECLSEKTHSFKSFLVVGTTSSNEDADFVGLKSTLVLLESANDTFKGGSDVGEVGNTSSDDEDLSILSGSASGDEVDWKRQIRLDIVRGMCWW
jgi:hypothetical protein